MMKMPHNHTYMTGREKAACGTLCMCLAVSVMSAVALVYLTVIIYLPAQRELASGIGETSVMCTTIERKKIVDDIFACRWSSCSEWCLSKGGGACTHLYVSVRSNGTDVEFEDCTGLVDKTCPTMDMTTVQKRNCKEDHQCTRLDNQFRCERGQCWNITAVYSCQWDPEDVEPTLDCGKKRNCVDLEGMYDCHRGHCSRILKWSCERRCNDIPVVDKNVAVMAGDRIIMANCRQAVNARSGESIWIANEHPDSVLMTSCTSLVDNGASFNLTDLFGATDCINGTILPKVVLGTVPTNYTVLIAVHQKYGPENKLDPDGNAERMPFEDDIMIFNKSRLMINHEGCVNTLSGECNDFYENHGKDGRNSTSPSRFPCFYAPHSQEFVVLRFDVTKTQWLFFVFFLVPAALLFISCSVLFACSRLLNVDNSGHMIMKCCKRGNSGEEVADENESDDEEVLPKEKSKKDKNKKKSKKRRKPSSSTRSSSRVPLHITSTGAGSSVIEGEPI